MKRTDELTETPISFRPTKAAAQWARQKAEKERRTIGQWLRLWLDEAMKRDRRAA